MAVILINPNSTELMTQNALAAARVAAPDVEFDGWTSLKGPASIEGPEDGAVAVPPLLDLVRMADNGGADAIIIACFDDTGLVEAQQIARCPVIGIGQASFVMASLFGGKAGVVTTVPEAVPVIQGNIAMHGLDHVVGQVIASGVQVLAIDHEPGVAAQGFIVAADHLDADVETIILGCAGTVSILNAVRTAVDKRVIDGVWAAARLCRALP